MAKFYPELNMTLQQFLSEQHMFFTATAAADGRINLSPKGMDSIRCLDEHTLAYLDLTGSGNETAAHLKADGRMTIMFCAFNGNPLILVLVQKQVRYFHVYCAVQTPKSFLDDDLRQIQLSYVAATSAPVASGFWDRCARPTCGRLRRVLAQVHSADLPTASGELRKKESVTSHLKTGVDGHRRQKAIRRPFATRSASTKVAQAA